MHDAAPGAAYSPQPLAPNGLGTAALVVGVIALVLALLPGIGLVAFLLGPVGLIIGIIAANKHGHSRSAAIGGISTSLIALVVAAGWMTYLVILGSSEQATTPRAGLTQFESQRSEDMPRDLRDNFVAFSLDYPADWTRGESPANFLLLRAPPGGINDSPAEFVVGTGEGTGDPRLDQSLFPGFVSQIQQQLGTAYDDVRIVWSGRGSIGRYDTLGLAYSARERPRDGGEAMAVAGRMDIVLPPGERRGVLLASIVRGRLADETSPRNLPASRLLEPMYDSFRFEDRPVREASSR